MTATKSSAFTFPRNPDPKKAPLPCSAPPPDEELLEGIARSPSRQSDGLVPPFHAEGTLLIPGMRIRNRPSRGMNTRRCILKIGDSG